MRVRVLTMNVQNDEGDGDRYDELARAIGALAPDLVALQEVPLPSVDDHLQRLLAGTGLRATHQADVMAYVPEFADRYGGNAVATRWPHDVVEVLDLRQAGALDVPWCTLAARVHAPDGHELLFVATTTSWRLDAEAARERQVVALTDLDARHRVALPTIIAGDLNATPDASSIRYLVGLQSLAGRSVHYHDSWTIAGDGPGYTWTVDNPLAAAEMVQIVRQPDHRRRLDYVLTGSWHAHPDTYCTVESARVVFDAPVGGRWLSDHFGVVVDLEIGPGVAPPRD
jgi:endonuclease/exonuclease/phosphatase family metal-dependent hydrolase